MKTIGFDEGKVISNPPSEEIFIEIKLTKAQVKKLIKNKQIKIGQFIFTIHD